MCIYMCVCAFFSCLVPQSSFDKCHGTTVSSWPRHPADIRGDRGRNDAMAAPQSFSGVMTPHDRCQMGQATGSS